MFRIPFPQKFGLVTHKNSTYKLLPGSYANASEAWNLVLFSKMYHLNLMHNHTGHNGNVHLSRAKIET